MPEGDSLFQFLGEKSGLDYPIYLICQDNNFIPQPCTHEELCNLVRGGHPGATPRAKVKGLDELPGKSNYSIGKGPKKWSANVPTHGKVKYQGVCPGVDPVCYGKESEVGSQDGNLLAPSPSARSWNSTSS